MNLTKLCFVSILAQLRTMPNMDKKIEEMLDVIGNTVQLAMPLVRDYEPHYYTGMLYCLIT